MIDFRLIKFEKHYQIDILALIFVLKIKLLILKKITGMDRLYSSEIIVYQFGKMSLV